MTSELTLDEIKRYFGPAREVVESTYWRLEKVPVVRWDELIGMHVYGDQYTWINSPMIQNDPLYNDFLGLLRRPRCATFVRGNKDGLCDLSHMRPTNAGERNGHS